MVRRRPDAAVVLAAWRVAADTLLLVAAALLGAWGSVPGLWVWTALCLAWAGDVLRLAPGPDARLRDAAPFVALLAPVALLTGLARVGSGPAPVVVGVVFVALLAGVWFVAFRLVVARTPRRRRRLLVARVAAWAAAAAVGAGLGAGLVAGSGPPWALGPAVLFVHALVPEETPRGPGIRLALHVLGWGLVVVALAWAGL